MKEIILAATIVVAIMLSTKFQKENKRDFKEKFCPFKGDTDIFWNPSDLMDGISLEDRDLSIQSGKWNSEPLRYYEVRAQNDSVLIVKHSLGVDEVDAIKSAFAADYLNCVTNGQKYMMNYTARAIESFPGECIYDDTGRAPNSYRVFISSIEEPWNYYQRVDSIIIIGVYKTILDYIIVLYPHLASPIYEFSVSLKDFAVQCTPNLVNMENTIIARLNLIKY